MNYQLISDLIDKVAEFHQQSNSNSLEDFRHWLNEQAYQKDNPTVLLDETNQKVYNLENEIAKQVILLNRFSKQMIRRGLADFPDLLNEEFTYLYRLMAYDSLSKMELVAKNGHEKQTGMMMIKRLVHSGLLEEFADPQDKRATRLRVTPEGKKLFNESIQEVTHTARVLSATLSISEKKQLLTLLKKMNDFHFMVYHHHKKSSIREIGELI